MAENKEDSTPEKEEQKTKSKRSSRRRKSLGRGLGALLSDENYATNVPSEEELEEMSEEEQGKVIAGSIFEIPLEDIETNPYQPRSAFDADQLEELKDSILSVGVVQPITVRQLAEGTYQLISGERRTRAARLAGLEKIPAFIRQANDEQMLEMALIENIQRANLNPIEVALGYQRLMDECELTIEQAGDRVGKRRSTVNNYLRLLKLPSEVQAGLRDEKISMGHARALITVDNPMTAIKIYNEIIEKGLSVRAVEERVRNLGKPKPKAEKSGPLSRREIELRSIERELENRFATRVQLKENNEGEGEIRLKFFSEEDFNRMLEILRNEAEE